MPHYVKLNPNKPSPKAQETLDFLLRNVIGQPEAVKEIADQVSLLKADMCDPNKPAGVFLLLGPTGTGKTHVVEKLAEAVHGLEKHLLKISCGEFAFDHDTAKIIGAPPGYLGHRETPPLFTQQKINNKKSSVFDYTIILLDEIEKAGGSLQKILLNIFDRARLTLGDNTEVNFSKCLFFMTSNLGAKEINRLVTNGMGLAPVTLTTSAAVAGAVTTTKKFFSPEFFNRIDKTITFKHLDHGDLAKILRLELNKVELRAAGKFYLKITPQAADWLLGKGFNKEYGARHLRRAINDHVTTPLSKCLISGQISRHGTVFISVSGEELVFKVEAKYAAGAE